MNIAPGLAAVNSYFDQNEHIQDRDYLAKQRDYQQAVMDANRGTLEDEASARVAASKLSAARAQAGLETLPQETANRNAQLGLDSENLTFNKKMLPTVQANAQKETQVRGAGLDSAIAQIPENERKRISDNASAANSRHLQALVDLSHYLTANDKAGALQHVNAVADAESVQSGTKGKKFVDIHAVGDGENRAFELVSQDGSKVSIPYAAVLQASSMAKTGKYKFIMDDATGRVVAGNENTGDVQEKVPGDPQRLKMGGGGKPSEMQMQFLFLTKHPDGPKLSPERAIEMITKGSHKTAEERYHAYKQELVKAAAGLNQPIDIEKISKQAAQLSGYDGQSTPGLSNTPSPVNNPKYENLFKP